MKIVSNNFAWVNRDISFTINGNAVLVNFDNKGVADIDEAHFDYLKQHGLEEYTNQNQVFDVNNLEESEKQKVLLSLPIATLREIASEISENYDIPAHEWTYLKQFALVDWILSQQAKYEESPIEEVEVPEKIKKTRKPKQ